MSRLIQGLRSNNCGVEAGSLWGLPQNFAIVPELLTVALIRASSSNLEATRGVICMPSSWEKSFVPHLHYNRNYSCINDIH